MCSLPYVGEGLVTRPPRVLPHVRPDLGRPQLYYRFVLVRVCTGYAANTRRQTTVYVTRELAHNFFGHRLHDRFCQPRGNLRHRQAHPVLHFAQRHAVGFVARFVGAPNCARRL